MQPEPSPEAEAASGSGRPAVGLAALAILLGLAALVVTTAAEVWHTEPAAQLLVDATAGIGCPAVAAVVLAAGRLRTGSRRLAWVLLIAGLASSSAALTTALGLAAGSDTDLARLWSQLQSFLWVPGFLPLLTLVPLLYPDGLLTGRVWRIATIASVVGIVLFSVGVALYDEPLTGQVEVPKLVTASTASSVLSGLGALLLLPSAGVAMVSLAVRYRRSPELGRRQLMVLAGAALVLAAVTAIQGLLPSPADVLTQAAAVALVPLAIGVAVTRHRLYDLDLAVCRALVAVGLAIGLTGAYLTVFAVVDAFGEGHTGMSAAVAAGVAGAVLQPLGRQLALAVDRLYFGHRADPFRITTHLAGRLAAAGVDVTDVPGIVCATVVEDLRLRGARILVVSGAGTEAAASTGVLDASQLATFALRHRGEEVGLLEIAPREGEARLGERDLELLQGIADQAAPAVAALHLHRDLQRSRESLVAAREAERRQLRRDLHDGLGATLAGLRLQVETARDLTDQQAAVQLLESASNGVAQAVAEVRTLCEGLRPPGIDDLGAARALAGLAERMSSPEVSIATDIDEDLDLDPGIEVALYRIAAEALANVVRHSGARRASLEVRADSCVELVVRDYGCGIASNGAPAATAGSGLGVASMRQRAEEVGGKLWIGSADGGGTLLRATLPLEVGGTT